ncbi:type II secretion system F family protein [Aliiroseovarius sp. CAU 1755]
MPQFSYSAFDANGKTVKGEVSALNELAALDQIARENLIPIQLNDGGGGLKWWQRDVSLRGDGPARPQVLTRFFQLLSIMLNANFPLPQSLAFCAGQIRDPKLKKLLAHAQRQVADGDTLAVALDDKSGTLPKRFLGAIQAGESSNQLATVVRQIAEGLGEELAIRREVRQALVYPVILIVMSILVIALLVFYLTPTLVPVFLSSQASPPVVLSVMDAIRLTVLENWPVVLIGTGALVAVLFLLRKRLAAYAAQLLRHIPGLRDFAKRKHSLTFCQTLLQYLSAGDRVQTAIGQARSAFHDPAWVSLLEQTHDQVVDGQTLAQALNGTELLDPLALAMIEAGEEGDQLVTTLQTAVGTLRDQTKQSLSQAVKLVTPLLTLLIGLGVGAVIMSTISAILDLNDIAF